MEPRQRYDKLPVEESVRKEDEDEEWIHNPSYLLYSFFFGFTLTLTVYIAFIHSHGPAHEIFHPLFTGSPHPSNYSTGTFSFIDKIQDTIQKSVELSSASSNINESMQASFQERPTKAANTTVFLEEINTSGANYTTSPAPTASLEKPSDCPLFINGSFEFSEEELGGMVILTRHLGPNSKKDNYTDNLLAHVTRMRATHLWGKYFIYLLHVRYEHKNYNEDDMERDYGHLRKDCRVRIVDITDQWVAMRPSWLSGLNMEHDVNKADGWSGEGYRYMCHFWLGPVFHVPALKHLQYMMRVDGEDGHYKWDKEDPFVVMEKGFDNYAYPYNYAYYWTGFDAQRYSVGVNEAVFDYMKKKQIAPFWDEQYIEQKENKSPMFYTNWEITRTAYFRSKPVADLIQAIVDARGIYEYRWGDAITRFFTVMAFSNDTQVWCVSRDEIGYHHKKESQQPIENCDARRDPRFVH